MTDGTLETIDGRPALRFDRTLAHSVERVWRAITEPTELERWFPAAADWTPATGETFEAYGATGARGHVPQAEPLRATTLAGPPSAVPPSLAGATADTRKRASRRLAGERRTRLPLVRCGRLVGTAGDARIPRDSGSGVP